MTGVATAQRVEFRTSPSDYRHWRLVTDGPVATLTMDVAEDAGLVEGYELKLNSYDLGVDIELYDAVQRLRFEHPEVRAVVVTSGKDKIFCAGANIFMLRGSSHAAKVNFCKFTNETRLAIEDASRGFDDMALRCDRRRLDDRAPEIARQNLKAAGRLERVSGAAKHGRIAGSSRSFAPGQLALGIEQRLLQVRIEPVAANGQDVAVQEPRSKQFADQEAHSAGGMKMVHVR